MKLLDLCYTAVLYEASLKTAIYAELTEALLQPTLISIPSQFLPFLWVIIGYITIAVAVSVFARNSNEIVSGRQIST